MGVVRDPNMLHKFEWNKVCSVTSIATTHNRRIDHTRATVHVFRALPKLQPPPTVLPLEAFHDLVRPAGVRAWDLSFKSDSEPSGK